MSKPTPSCVNLWRFEDAPGEYQELVAGQTRWRSFRWVAFFPDSFLAHEDPREIRELRTADDFAVTGGKVYIL